MPVPTAGPSSSDDELSAFLSTPQAHAPADEDDELGAFLSAPAEPPKPLLTRLSEWWHKPVPPAIEINQKTGQPTGTPPLGTIPILDAPIEGVPQMGRGARNLVTGSGGRMNAASDVIEGAMKTAEPIMAGTAIVNPLAAARLLAVGTAGQKITEATGRAVGADPSFTRLASNVAGLAVPGAFEAGVHQVPTAPATEPVPARVAPAEMAPGTDELGSFLQAQAPALEGMPVERRAPLDESGRDLGGYAGPERRAPVLPEPTPAAAVDRILEKSAAGETPGTQAARDAFSERQRVESARDELAQFMQQEDTHAAPIGEQPPDDLEQHLGTDQPREPAPVAEADHRDSPLGGAEDSGREETAVPPAVEEPAVAEPDEAPTSATRRLPPDVQPELFETGIQEAPPPADELLPAEAEAGQRWSSIVGAGGKTKPSLLEALRRGAGAEEIDSLLAKRPKPPRIGTRRGAKGTVALEDAGGTTLQSTILPGAKQFAEQDVVPALKAAGETVARAADDIQRAFAVTSRSNEAATTGGIIRARSAEFAHRTARAEDALKGASRVFDRMDPAHNLTFIDDVEHGRPTANADLQPVQKALRDMLDGRRREVRARGRLNQVIENYFPHIWKDPNAAKEWMRGLFGKKPLQGPKNFLKKRTIETTADGLAAGLTPVSTNPVTLTLLKVREMDKWITGHDVLEDMKAAQVAKYVPVGGEAPEGWSEIADPIGTVYGNPNVPIYEAHDADMMTALGKLAQDLGVKHERLVKLKGGPRGAWGLSYQGASRVETRFGGSEPILTHEIGHQIDEKYGLWNALRSLEGRYKAEGYEDWSLAKELRNVTDLTWEGRQPSEGFKQYVRKKEEKIANLVAAYVHVPEKFKQVAPNVFDVFDELVDKDPILQQLRTIKPSMVLSQNAATTRVGGMVTNGHWWAPAEAAQVLNQHLAPGLAGNALFDVYRAAGNTVTQAKFALSAFHAVVESVNSVLSKAALAGQYATPRKLGGYGDLSQAAKKSGEIVVAPIVDYLRGRKAVKSYLADDLTGDPTTSLVDQIVQGGGRVKWDDFYHSDMSKAFMTALRSGNYPGAAIRAPFALNEQLGAKVIMGNLVPRLKLGAYLDLARAEMSKLKPDASQAETQAALGKAWDSVDNRFGELVYDNLFWPKWIKDVGQVTTRALGWNLGTVRELGGAVMDTGKAAKAVVTGETPEVTPRMAYATSLGVVGTLFMGSVINYLYTGERPRDVKDMIFPRTGKTTPDGHEERIKLPTYAPDVYEFSHDPAHTAANKMSDLTSALIEIAENKDRRNVQVRDPEASVGEQAKQLGKYAAEKFEPISVSNARRAAADGRSPLAGFAGLSQAPAAISRSTAEQMIHDFTQTDETRTLKQEAQRQQRQDIRRDVRQGDMAGARAIAREGDLGRRSIQLAAKGAKLTSLQAGFKRLTLDQALQVFNAATPEERAAVRTELSAKITNTLKNAPPDDIPSLRARIAKARDLPVARPFALKPAAGQ